MKKETMSESERIVENFMDTGRFFTSGPGPSALMWDSQAIEFENLESDIAATLSAKDTEIQKLQQENEQLAMGQAVLVQEVERIQGAIDQARLNADPETETKLFNIIANIDNILGRYTTRSKAMLDVVEIVTDPNAWEYTDPNDGYQGGGWSPSWQFKNVNGLRKAVEALKEGE